MMNESSVFTFHGHRLVQIANSKEVEKLVCSMNTNMDLAVL